MYLRLRYQELFTILESKFDEDLRVFGIFKTLLVEILSFDIYAQWTLIRVFSYDLFQHPD